MPETILHFAKASTEITMLVQIPHNTDNMLVHFHGSQFVIEHVISAWKQILRPDWLAQHGRQMAHQIVSDQHQLLIFAPNGQNSATPVSIFRPDIMICIAKAGLQAFSQHQPACEFQFNLHSRHLLNVPVADR